jgi:mannose-6-phosphate isomerase-like protein (cupin superfamily)
MPVAVEINIPGMSAPHYDQMLANLGPSLLTAPGFVAHAAGATEGGWRIVEIWQSEQEYGRFAAETVAPLAQKFGMTVPPPSIQPLHRAVTANVVAGDAPVPAELLGPDDGKRFKLGPIEILVKEDGGGTRQRLAVAEFRGKNYRIPPHIHTEHDENIFVVKGPIQVRLGERVFTAETGSSFTIPVQVPHSMWNETGNETSFLNIIAPARYLEYFRELSMAATEALPPKEKIVPIMQKFGLRPVP